MKLAIADDGVKMMAMVDCKYELLVQIESKQYRSLHTHKANALAFAKRLWDLGADGVLVTDIYAGRESFRHGIVAS